MRPSGYYWVKRVHFGWIIGQWSHLQKVWTIFISDKIFDDLDFEEIDERQIKRDE